MAQEQHLFPFVCRTIRAPLADAFVAVARAGKSGTRNIKQNAADRTFLLHVFLIGWGIEGSLILPIYTSIAKKADIFGHEHLRQWIDKTLIVWYDTIIKTDVITLTEYQGFQDAYDFFNRELFEGSLPQVLVTLQRHANTRGYFSPERFSGRIDKSAVHELALNPDGFAGRTDEMILSTLVHEMVHVWQQTHGKAPRRGYHDRQWAGKMREVGLQPSSTGEEGGKETGQSVTHYISAGGRYEKAYAKLAASGFELHWQSAPASGQGRAKKSSKTKFTCPDCGQNAWAKPDALLICGECYDEGEGDISLMLSEQEV